MSFVWGDGGKAVTPEDAKSRRAMAMALMQAGIDGKPIQHWTQGAANVAKALMGAWEMNQIDKQESSARDEAKKLGAALLGGGGDAPTAPININPAAGPVGAPAEPPAANVGGGGVRSPGMAGVVKGGDTYTGAPKGLFASESGGRFDAQNDVMGAGGQRGHFGRVQFGQARLQEAANAGAIPQGTTPQQFMASPEMQRSAERWHFGDIDKSIRDMGIDTSGRMMIGGVPVTRDGLVAVAHLGGTTGMRKFVESGGKYNPADENGTRLSDYFARMQGNSAQTQPNASPAPQVAQAQSSADLGRAMAVLNNPYSSPGDKVAAQLIMQKRLAAETKDPVQAALQQAQLDKLRKENARVPFSDITRPDNSVIRRFEDGRQETIAPAMQKPAEPTSAQRELDQENASRAQAGKPPMSILDYSVAKARASATNINMGGGSDKQIFDAMDESAKDAKSAAMGLQSIRDARAALQGGGVFGAGADAQLTLRKIGAAMGITGDDNLKKIVNTETFRSAIAPQVASMLKATVGSANISNSDREFAEKAAGGSITLDQASITKLLDIMERGNMSRLESHQARLDAVYPDDAEKTRKRERALFGVAVPQAVPSPATPIKRPAGQDPLGLFQ